MRRSLILAGLLLVGVVPAADAAGKVTFLAASDVDYIDPGQTWYSFG